MGFCGLGALLLAAGTFGLVTDCLAVGSLDEPLDEAPALLAAASALPAARH